MSARRIMSADEVERALVRIGHEMVEEHGGADGLELAGIQHPGPALAERIAAACVAAGLSVLITSPYPPVVAPNRFWAIA